MDLENRALTHLQQRRRLLLGTAAALCPFGTHTFAATAAKPLLVGALPVTCNLTLPVACTMTSAADARNVGGRPFEFSKYSGWPEIKESFMANRVSATYMLAPLAMDMADKKIPVKIVGLGHRSGAVIMDPQVRDGEPAGPRDLRRPEAHQAGVRRPDEAVH